MRAVFGADAPAASDHVSIRGEWALGIANGQARVDHAAGTREGRAARAVPPVVFLCRSVVPNQPFRNLCSPNEDFGRRNKR
jgi:hypothetical protein